MVQMSRSVQVDARPFPLAIDPWETAIIVVDMQQGFFGAGGAWDRVGIDVAGAQAAVAPTACVLAAARRAGMPVVYLTVAFGEPGPDTRLWNAERAARWVAAAGADGRTPHARVLPAGAQDADILPELAARPGDTIVVKTRHSGFYNTDLHSLLKGLGVTTLVFTGGTTSICVESTLRDAYFRDYRCLLLTDCTAEPIGNRFLRTNHEATVLLVELVFGWVADSAAFVRALAERPVAVGAE
jgi:ureidoacrylate peracid hydrolase